MQTVQKMLLDNYENFKPMAWKWRDLFDNDPNECMQEICKDFLEIGQNYLNKNTNLPDINYLRRAVYNKMLYRIRHKGRLYVRNVEPIVLMDDTLLDEMLASNESTENEIDIKDAFDVFKKNVPSWFWELVNLMSKTKFTLRQSIAFIKLRYPEIDLKEIKNVVRNVIKESYDCGLEMLSKGFAKLFIKLGV